MSPQQIVWKYSSAAGGEHGSGSDGGGVDDKKKIATFSELLICVLHILYHLILILWSRYNFHPEGERSYLLWVTHF